MIFYQIYLSFYFSPQLVQVMIETLQQLWERFVTQSSNTLVQSTDVTLSTISNPALASGQAFEIRAICAYPMLPFINQFGRWLEEERNQVVEIDYEVQLDDEPRFKTIKHIVLVASGKGGVGKSTTAANIAVALQQQGAKVGLLDADIYGPSVPLMFGLAGEKLVQSDGLLLPKEQYGIVVSSIGFLIDDDKATVWRGPMASQALGQLINETAWGELDYLIVDLPPGTGDIQLTLAQRFPVSGSVVVTTPQDLALADAEKGIAMFSKVNIPILGLVENMSVFHCENCGHEQHIFGDDGASDLANRYNTPVLGYLPLEKSIRVGADKGKPVALDSTTAIGQRYQDIAFEMAARLCHPQQQTFQQPTIQMTDD